MNEHIPDELREKWPQYEFVGIPIKRVNGRTYIRAKRKHWPYAGETHIYSVDDDFFWHAKTLSDLP